MIIREVRKEDLENVAKLNMKLDRYESKWFPFSEVDLNKSKKYIEKSFKNRKCKIFVAIEDGKMIGYSLGQIKRMKYHNKIKKFGYYCDCFVLSKYRGREVCKKLTEKFIGWFKLNNLKYVVVGSCWKNVLGRKVWKSLGFKEHSVEMFKVIK